MVSDDEGQHHRYVGIYRSLLGWWCVCEHFSPDQRFDAVGIRRYLGSRGKHAAVGRYRAFYVEPGDEHNDCGVNVGR